MTDEQKANALLPAARPGPAPTSGPAEGGTLKGRRGVGTPKYDAHKARTIVVTQVSYQRAGAHEPVTLSSRTARLHDQSIQAYVRELTLTPGEWVKADCGWIESPGLVVVSVPPPAVKAPMKAVRPSMKGAQHAAPKSHAPGTVLWGLCPDLPDKARDQHSPPRVGVIEVGPIAPGAAQQVELTDFGMLRLKATGDAPIVVKLTVLPA